MNQHKSRGDTAGENPLRRCFVVRRSRPEIADAFSSKSTAAFLSAAFLTLTILADGEIFLTYNTGNKLAFSRIDSQAGFNGSNHLMAEHMSKRGINSLILIRTG